MANFLQEDNGNNSSMRLMCFMMSIACIVSGFMTLYATDTKAGLYITGLFAVAAFCPKALQKFMETKV